jgi:uncharacterized protein YjbI with pentapeptide repeats
MRAKIALSACDRANPQEIKMKKFLSVALVAYVTCAAPAFAISEADDQRLNNGEGCPGCDLSYANLSGMNLSNQDLSGANFTGTSLNGAEFYNANLTDANLTDANLGNANLSRANLTGGNLSRIHPLNIKGATFTDALFCNTTWIDGTGRPCP